MPEEERDHGVGPRAGAQDLAAAGDAERTRAKRLPVPSDLQLETALRALRSGQGSERDEEVVFKRLYRPLMTLFGNRHCQPDEAEDLTQVVLDRVFKRLGDYRSEGAFWSWVKRIAMNVLSNYLRDRETLKRGADRVVPLEREQGGDEDAAPRSVPRREASVEAAALGRVLAAERHLHLRDALELLPERLREVVALRLGDLSYEEIAETLGVGPNTVGSQLNAATKKLRRILAASFPELGDGEEP